MPIVGGGLDPTGEPLSFWAKAILSIKSFVGQEELSGKQVSAELMSSFRDDEFVYIHPDNLQILLDNLSDNAVKYSFEDEVVSMKLSRQCLDGEEHAFFSISNYGNGIHPSERGKIGEKLYRGMYSSTLNTHKEGTGLGVYIVRRMVERVKGRWDWKSVYGGGENYVPGEGFRTSFYVWLPIVTGDPKRREK